MEVTIQPATIKEYLEADGSGRVEVSATWTIGPQLAKRKVNGVMADQIGMLIGLDPSLVISNGVRWRVPVVLAYKDLGNVGLAGYVDVDANTGEVLATDELIKNLTQQASHLAQRALAIPV